ncbi:GNAT family N-acetyltransferase [Amycolatopsis lurida]
MKGTPPAVTADPAAADLDELVASLVASRPSTLPPENREKLASFVRGEHGELLGGIAGHTNYGWLFIAQLWVHESTRGQGLGASLLRAAEDEARRRGCRSAWLDTYSFQARPFYEAHGYRVFGELPGFPAGYRKYFLCKEL